MHNFTAIVLECNCKTSVSLFHLIKPQLMMFPLLLLLFIFFTQCIFSSLYCSTFFTYLNNRNLNLTIIHLNVNTLHSQIKHHILLDELSIYLKIYYIDTMNNTLNDRFKLNILTVPGRSSKQLLKSHFTLK